MSSMISLVHLTRSGVQLVADTFLAQIKVLEDAGQDASILQEYLECCYEELDMRDRLGTN